MEVLGLPYGIHPDYMPELHIEPWPVKDCIVAARITVQSDRA